MTDKLPVCGKTFSDGTCVDGMIEAPDTTLVRRCECRYRQLTADEARRAGISATVTANPGAFKAAVAIIEDAAQSRSLVNGNTVRAAMEAAQVPGPTVGAAFSHLVKAKRLRRIGSVRSTDPGTHGHLIGQFEVVAFTAGRAAS